MAFKKPRIAQGRTTNIYKALFSMPNTICIIYKGFIFKQKVNEYIFIVYRQT